MFYDFVIRLAIFVWYMQNNHSLADNYGILLYRPVKLP